MTHLQSERIVWLDVESDGLDPYAGQQLLQLAGIVTDGNLVEIGEGIDLLIHHTPEEVRRMKSEATEEVRLMHERTGLWDQVSYRGVHLTEAENQFLTYLRQAGVKAGQARLGGNSVTLDRNFLKVYMPRVASYLHYRTYDMTSISGFFRLYRDDVPQPMKLKSHNAMDDIRECIDEARHFRHYLQLSRPHSIPLPRLGESYTFSGLESSNRYPQTLLVTGLTLTGELILTLDGTPTEELVMPLRQALSLIEQGLWKPCHD